MIDIMQQLEAAITINGHAMIDDSSDTAPGRERLFDSICAHCGAAFWVDAARHTHNVYACVLPCPGTLRTHYYTDQESDREYNLCEQLDNWLQQLQDSFK